MALVASLTRTLLSLAFASVHAWQHVSGEDELRLKLKENDVAAVAFVNPSDARTPYLETEWDLAATDSEIPFVSIDCSENSRVCEAWDSSESNTIVKLFKQNEAISTYVGPRRSTAITAWINRVQRPTLTIVTEANLEEFKKSDEVVFVAFLKPDDKYSIVNFEAVASKFREEFTFGLTTDPGAAYAELVRTPTLKCYKHLDEDSHETTDLSQEEILETWIKVASRPLIAEMLPHNYHRLLARGAPIVYILSPHESQRQEIRQELSNMARRYYKGMTIVLADPVEYPTLASRLHLEPPSEAEADGDENRKYPLAAVHQLSSNAVYPYPRGRQFTERDITAYGMGVMQGWVTPIYLSKGDAAVVAGDGEGEGEGEGKGEAGAGITTTPEVVVEPVETETPVIKSSRSVSINAGLGFDFGGGGGKAKKGKGGDEKKHDEL